MNRKTTLILACLFAVFAAYIGFFESRGPSTRERGEQSTRVLGRFNREKVDALLIRQGDRQIDLRRDPAPAEKPKEGEPPAPARWRMQSPIADRADAQTVDTLLSDLESYRRESTVAVPGANADPAKLAAYGLQTPRLRLKITPKPGDKDAPPEAEILFGNATPVDGRLFVQVAGREEVYAASDTLLKTLQKAPGEFRDPAFTDLTAAEFGRLTVKGPAGAVLELARDGDHWKLLKPQAARAGDQKLGELVNRLAELRVSRFLPADDKAAVGAMAEPRGTLTLSTGDTPPRTVELVLGKAAEAMPAVNPAAAPPPAEIYVTSPGRPGVLVVPRTVEEFFNLKPEDVRDRQLARVNPDTVDRVRIQPAGGPVLTFSRVKGKSREWTMREGDGAPERPANGGEVERLLTRLPTQVVSGFVADTAGDLPKFGLDQPAVRVTFLAVASEPTAEGGAGEKPVATFSFGKIEGVNAFARLEEEPFVVTVPKGTLDAVPTDPVAWQAPEIFSVAADKVRTLAVTLRDQPEVALERSGTESTAWKLVKGTGAPDGTQAASVANTLARLRAVRWVGATKPEHALDQPEATASFTTSETGQPGGKVFIGARAPEGGWFARVDGRAGTFLMNAPDHETLTRPLVAAPPATASPTPPAANVVSPAVATPVPAAPAAPATP